MKTSIRFNSEDWETHSKLKQILLLKGTHGEDSETIKIAENIALSVLHNFFGNKLTEIFRRARTQQLSQKRLGRPKKPQIVPHPLSVDVGQNQTRP